jgi:molybdenum cofactor guanylyltransferase
MPVSDEAVTLAILAGGRARRLGGVPKGLLLRAGRPLLADLLALAPRFADAFLVTSTPRPYAALGVRTVADVIADRGAPGGVHAALVRARTPWVLVLAADMPFVTVPVIELLLAQRAPAVDAVGFEVRGRLEPLLACYRTALATEWGAALDDGPSFQRLWQRVRARVLPEEALAQVDVGCRSVLSVNTPEDADAYGVSLPDESAPS